MTHRFLDIKDYFVLQEPIFIPYFHYHENQAGHNTGSIMYSYHYTSERGKTSLVLWRTRILAQLRVASISFSHMYPWLNLK